MNIPSFDEWKKLNIGKSLNDYFEEYPKARLIPHKEPIIVNNIQNQFIPPDGTKSEPALNVVSIIMSILILVAFFLPWIKVDVLGLFYIVNSSGYGMLSIVKTLNGTTEGTMIWLIFLIPIGALIAAISEGLRLWTKTVAQIVTIIGVLYAAYILNVIMNYAARNYSSLVDIFDFLHIGVWLTFFVAVYYVYEITLAILRGMNTKS